nr:MAG TPA_asm: hypothetical protein [Caudoviricetes sp.]
MESNAEIDPIAFFKKKKYRISHVHQTPKNVLICV